MVPDLSLVASASVVCDMVMGLDPNAFDSLTRKNFSAPIDSRTV